MAPSAEEKTETPNETDLKCRACEDILPVADFTYSQKKKKHRRKCSQCVAIALYLRGDGPKPAGADVEPSDPSRIELTNQLLPPQKLSAVSHLNAIVAEAAPSGPGPRRQRAVALPMELAEKDLLEENLGFKKPADKTAAASSTPKPGHARKPSADDQRALYKRQLKGRAVMRASREFNFTEEEKGELLQGPQGRKRLSVVEGGYLRPSMKPGKPRIIGGDN